MSGVSPRYFKSCAVCQTIMWCSQRVKYCCTGCVKSVDAERARICRLRDIAKNQDRARLRRTGWTREEYRWANLLQCGVCAICESECRFGELCADHNHETGAKRALLCKRCNVGIGSFRDNPDLCARAAEYLDNYKDQPV